MKLESLTCNNCGGPLEVPEGVNSVRCNHCSSQLAVRREASVTYTELIQQVSDRTERLTEQVVQLRYESELDRIDRDWEHQRESLMITNKNGRQSEPSYLQAVVVAVVGGGMCIFAMSVFGPMGVPFLLIVVIMFAGVCYKTASFSAAKQRYQQRRRSVTMDDIRERVIAEQESNHVGDGG